MFKVNNKDTRTTPSVSIVNFEHVIADWEVTLKWILSRFIYKPVIVQIKWLASI